jgi:hypothetical protein
MLLADDELCDGAFRWTRGNIPPRLPVIPVSNLLPNLGDIPSACVGDEVSILLPASGLPKSWAMNLPIV